MVERIPKQKPSDFAKQYGASMCYMENFNIEHCTLVKRLFALININIMQIYLAVYSISILLAGYCIRVFQFL